VKSQKICRFTLKNSSQPSFGLVEDDNIFVLDTSQSDVIPPLNATITQQRLKLDSVRLLPPSIPTKIVCIGRNYKKHAEELGNKMPPEPLIFLKPTSSVIATGESIILPTASKQVEHEGEIGVVIGRTCSKISPSENPLKYVYGYTCLNDVTARDLQRKDVQFTRGKSFDTFCPVGPFAVTNLDPTNLTVTTRVNGITKQMENSSNMAFPISEIIRFISQVMTLFPGDIIATGTPAGVSKLNPNDIVEVVVDGIGVLSNPVADSLT